MRFDARDLSEAIQKAEAILKEPTCLSKASTPVLDSFPKIQIGDALLKAAEHRNWSESTRKEDYRNCEYFLDWVDKERLVYWHELRFEHVQKYKKQLEDRGMAFDTIRLYLIPIRRTAAWMSTNWPKDYINICQNLRLSRRNHHASTYNEEEGNPVLTIHQVLDFLDWLTRNNKPCQLAIGVALQGLVGLQMLEALRLRWENVDLNENTIIIDGLVKNRYRIRKIPIPNVVAWFLRQNKLSHDKGLIITEYSSHDEYSRAIRRELQKWDSAIVIKPKDLRNTLQTLAIDNGWYDYIVQRYVGHAPQTIGQRHYHGDKGNRLIQLYKEKVLSRIEEEISSWEGPQDTRIIMRPKLVINH